MAQRVNIELVDDLDGSDADRTVQLAYNGRAVELDLSEKNRTKLEKALERYLAAGRKVSGTTKRRPQATRGSTAKEIRTWAQSVGITVPERGRIPATVIDQYTVAN